MSGACKMPPEYMVWLVIIKLEGFLKFLRKENKGFLGHFNNNISRLFPKIKCNCIFLSYFIIALNNRFGLCIREKTVQRNNSIYVYTAE